MIIDSLKHDHEFVIVIIRVGHCLM